MQPVHSVVHNGWWVRTLGCGLLVVCGWFDASAEDALRLVTPATVRLGRHRSSERKVASFTLENTGGNVVVIDRVRVTCGCAAAGVGAKGVQPGEQTTVKVELLPESMSGPYTKHAYVEYRTGERQAVRLTFSGWAVPLIEVRPRSTLNLGQIAAGQSSRHVFTLQTTEPGVALGEPAVSGNCSTDVRLVRAPGGPDQHELTVSLTPDGKAARVTSTVTVPIVTPENREPVVIRLSASVTQRMR